MLLRVVFMKEVFMAKLRNSGSETFEVTIPKKLVKKNNIKPGNKLEMTLKVPVETEVKDGL